MAGGVRSRRQTGAKEARTTRAASLPADGDDIGYYLRSALIVTCIVCALGAGLVGGVYMLSRDSKEITKIEVPCSAHGRDEFDECKPLSCARIIVRDFVKRDDALRLRQLAQSGIESTGGSSGGASILDLHTGAVSKGENFVDVYRVLGERANEVLLPADVQLYNRVRRRIQAFVKAEFAAKRLWLTNPAFFSRMVGDRPAKTMHDEYWHTHVDTTAYPTFEYTSLLYLSDHGRDFEGGEFVFDDAQGNHTVLPRVGTLVVFTSGQENRHHVERVTNGTRFAMTLGYTCDAASELVGFLDKAMK